MAEQGLVKCATDVTGFGLLGHLISLCRSSGVHATLNASDIPMIDPEITRLIEDDGCVPGGTKENLNTANEDVDWGRSVSDASKYLLADAQTSGGLLCCVPEKHLKEVLAICDEDETLCQVVVGQITAADEGPLVKVV
jgi:selenide,water dikinase